MESLYSAAEDFRRARNRAALQEIVARLTGKSTELLSYEDVRRKVRASGVISRSLQEIPLDAIVGSVGRYRDFSRSFLPLQDSDQERWARVKIATTDLRGLPPVEVYQIGEAFFVHDGHHRVSVARQFGADTVQAYVTEIRSKVPITADIQPGELILVAEYADFLDSTQLDQLRPEADLSVTAVGQYQKLLEHIEVHRHYMGIDEQREIPYEEAVLHWFDNVYMPVIKVIRELGILHDFPNRTETDLYLWIGKHRADLEASLGWDIPYGAVAADLAEEHSSRWSKVISRIGKRALDVVVPDEIEPGPAPGQWRRERLAVDLDERLFQEILVPINGEEVGWVALEQAIEVARRENGRLHGLYVVSEEEDVEGENVEAIRDRFYWRCGEVGLPGKFAVDQGSIARTIFRRARYNDLVVVNLAHPPGDSSWSRLASGFRTLVRRCSRPILAVPGEASPLNRPLLAYGGTPKAKEALFVATYLTGRWQLPLVVVSVQTAEVTEMTLADARQYLETHGLEATYVKATGEVVEMVLATADEYCCDWIIMGGYGANPVLEVVMGTIADQILAQSEKPMLIGQ
jgi:nucleotide-binding universal stress UspA family protein